MFENDVKIYGIQTKNNFYNAEEKFGNDVKRMIFHPHEKIDTARF